MAQLVWTISPDGRITYVNRRSSEYFGLTAEQALSVDWAAHIHPDDAATMFPAWVAALQTEQPWEYRYRLRRADGVYRWFLARSMPMFEGDRVVRWVGTATDIDAEVRAQASLAESNAQLSLALDERRQAEQVLAENERRLRLLQETSPDGFIVFAVRRDEAGRARDLVIKYINPSAAPFIGIPVSEALGRSLLEIAPGVPESPFWATFLRVADTGAPAQVEAAHEASGQRAWYRATCTRVGSELAVIFADITRPKRVEETLAFMADVNDALGALLDEAATLQRLADTLVRRMADSCAVYLIGEQGRVRLAAAADFDPARIEVLRRMSAAHPLRDDAPHGYARALRTGAPELLPEVTADITAALATSEEHRDLMEALGPRSWITAPVSLRGRVVGAISITSRAPGRSFNAADLAIVMEVARRAGMALENIRLYQEAQEANRLKDEFLAVASHELRTPLTAIAGWTAMLLGARGSDPAFVRRGLEAIARNVKAQTHLIDDILDTSRIITGKLRVELQPVPIDRLLLEAADVVRPPASAKGVALEVDCGDCPCLVLGDADRLRQVIWNLLSNAVKFTPGGGRIAALMRRSGGLLLLEVIDTGKGIAPAFLPHVFERFRQADSSTTRSHGGLGLGLAIVRHLVELHGGWVSVESAGEDRGSKFTVALPLAPSSPAVASAGQRGTAGAPAQARVLAGMSVLLLEDDRDTRDMLGEVLAEAGAQVSAAPAADEALEALARGAFDVVISDIGLPERDGYWFMAQARALHRDVPVVALSAYTSEADRERARRAGFADYLAKPVSPSTLYEAVARFRQGSSSA